MLFEAVTPSLPSFLERDQDGLGDISKPGTRFLIRRQFVIMIDLQILGPRESETFPSVSASSPASRTLCPSPFRASRTAPTSSALLPSTGKAPRILASRVAFLSFAFSVLSCQWWPASSYTMPLSCSSKTVSFPIVLQVEKETPSGNIPRSLPGTSLYCQAAWPIRNVPPSLKFNLPACS